MCGCMRVRSPASPEKACQKVQNLQKKIRHTMETLADYTKKKTEMND